METLESTVERVRAQLVAEQRLVPAMAGAVVTALLGAAVWALVTVATGYQIGWMALGVGFVVGAAVRALGRGISPIFGFVGAAAALAGCVLGNLLSVCGFVAKQGDVPFTDVAAKVFGQPTIALELLQASFTPMDLLFYGIAMYEGYKFAFRRITPQDLQNLGVGTQAPEGEGTGPQPT